MLQKYDWLIYLTNGPLFYLAAAIAKILVELSNAYFNYAGSGSRRLKTCGSMRIQNTDTGSSKFLKVLKMYFFNLKIVDFDRYAWLLYLYP